MSMMVEAEPGLSLDRFVDWTLSRDAASADWSHLVGGIGSLLSGTGLASSGAEPMFNPQSLDRGRGLRGGAPGSKFTALERLAGSALSYATRRDFRDETSALGAVGHLAANLLASLDLKPLVERFLRRDISDFPTPIIVYHGDENARRSVLLLIPDLEIGGSVIPGELIQSMVGDAWPSIAASTAVRSDSRFAKEPRLLLEALLIARPRLIVGSRPAMEDNCVRHPAAEVVCGNRTSTTGAWVRNTEGLPGVTVCFHGSGPAGTALEINGRPYTVTAASEALDIAFVRVDERDLPAQAGMKARAGPLLRRAPGAQELHSFWAGGGGGAVKQVQIIASDFGLPQPTPQRQLCLYTDPKANYGDSGSALVNEDDQLVGFCFQRTAFGAPLQFATWVWARSALEELGLKPI